MISEDKMILVPAQVLQNLIWNFELGFAGSEPIYAFERAIVSHCDELQKYLVDAYPSAYEGDDFSFEMFDKVIFADFVKRTWS